MRPSVLWALLVVSTVPSCAQTPRPPAANHPILGTWTVSVPGTTCSEVYTFRADGTRTYSSGEERGESAFEISAARSERGFYALTDTVTHNNGKPDCSGGTTPVGDKVTLFIMFHPKNTNEFIMCYTESLSDCVGPFKRVRDGAS